MAHPSTINFGLPRVTPDPMNPTLLIPFDPTTISKPTYAVAAIKVDNTGTTFVCPFCPTCYNQNGQPRQGTKHAPHTLPVSLSGTLPVNFPRIQFIPQATFRCIPDQYSGIDVYIT